MRWLRCRLQTGYAPRMERLKPNYPMSDNWNNKDQWIKMMLNWNMNNGTDGFIEFYGNHHPSWRNDEETLSRMVESGDITDHWIQEQHNRWFEGTNRFMAMAVYHAVDPENHFFEWLLSKS